MNHIHAIIQVIEKYAEYIYPRYLAFIDYEKAFDYVETGAVMKALQDQGVEETHIRLLQDIYKDRTGPIILHKQSDKFPIMKGVGQRNTISPNLYTARLESVFRNQDREQLGIRVNGEHLGHLILADDIVLLTDSLEGLQDIIQDLQCENLVLGLTLNMKKSKVMPNGLAMKQPFTIGNEVLEEGMNAVIWAK